mmetsp:Transcript_29935/g.91857  ORF Transcript_29935/g.91857 Transcript_29935/m.91857 type:complete len:236 (+) Transcript_29935:282-989(+)
MKAIVEHTMSEALLRVALLMEHVAAWKRLGMRAMPLIPYQALEEMPGPAAILLRTHSILMALSMEQAIIITLRYNSGWPILKVCTTYPLAIMLRQRLPCALAMPLPHVLCGSHGRSGRLPITKQEALWSGSTRATHASPVFIFPPSSETSSHFRQMILVFSFLEQSMARCSIGRWARFYKPAILLRRPRRTRILAKSTTSHIPHLQVGVTWVPGAILRLLWEELLDGRLHGRTDC